MLPDSTITDVIAIPNIARAQVIQTVEALDPVPLPQLTLDEDTFCLAVVEYGGNLRRAFQEIWPDKSQPSARARALLARREIDVRIRDLGTSVTEQSLISLGSHMVELAEIRDLAKAQGNTKDALASEVARGKVAGFYVGKGDSAPPARKPGELENPTVVIQISTHQDASI